MNTVTITVSTLFVLALAGVIAFGLIYYLTDIVIDFIKWINTHR